MSELIDCHAHIYRNDLPFSATAWHRPEHDATHEEFAANLADNGVDAAILAGMSTLADDNCYALDACRQHPDWRTTVIAPPGTSPGILADWDRSGAVGIRLQCMHQPVPDFTSAAYQSLFRSVMAHNWHIQVHDHGPRLAVFLPTLLQTGARIVVDHFGRPDSATGRDGAGYQAMLKGAETGRLWVKLSAGFRLGSPAFALEMAQHVISDFGPERLVWGSDWPFAGFEKTMTYKDARATFEAWVPETMRQQIGSLTPRALYF